MAPPGLSGELGSLLRAQAAIKFASMAAEADKVVSKVEKGLDTAQIVLDVTKFVSTVGAQLPVIGGVFGICKEIIDKAQELKDKGDELAQASRRAVEVLQFVQALPATLAKLSDEKRAQVESKLAPLQDVLEDFLECVRAFASKGFLKKKILTSLSSKHVKTLGSLDSEIARHLEHVTRWFDLAVGDRMLELQERLLQERATERTYQLEAEIDRRVREHMQSQGVREAQAVAALVADPVVVQVRRSGACVKRPEPTA